MSYAPPPVLFEGREWSSDELTGLALTWREEIAREVDRWPGVVAHAMANHPEAVALLFALSSLPAPVVLLPPDLRGWQSSPPVPAGTPLFLPPALHALAAEGERLGLRARRLGAPATPVRARPAAFMTAPALVFFTSGSTGAPRPVSRTFTQLVTAGLSPMKAIGWPAQARVIVSLPLDRSFGMHQGLMAATVLGRPLALQRRFQPHALLALFASGEYHYWAGTPVMADVLSRCRLPEGAPLASPAPPFCIVGGRPSASVSETFRKRFGVPLRQLYGTTETAAITMDAAPAHLVRPETAGRPLPGVSLRIGDDPRMPLGPGAVGRVWVSTPGCTAGYGFPPVLEPPSLVDGWWPSPDVGEVDRGGTLALAGRLDDCVRTRAGHVVSPAAVASALESYPGVVETVVVPIGPSADPVLAVLLESAVTLDMQRVRDHLATRLPAWSQPRVIEQTRALPRLASGRADRRACIARLEHAR